MPLQKACCVGFMGCTRGEQVDYEQSKNCTIQADKVGGKGGGRSWGDAAATEAIVSHRELYEKKKKAGAWFKG